MKKWRNMLAISMAVMVAVGTILTGCGNGGQSGQTSAAAGNTAAETTAAGQTSADSTGGGSDKVLTVMTYDMSRDLSTLPIAKKMAENYDGTIEWVLVDPPGGTEKLNLLMASGDYGDVGISNLLQDTDVSKYAANGVLVALDDYINEDITPNLCKLFEKHPETRAVATNADGHIYALPRYNGFAWEFLEDVIYINKEWMEKLNLEIPTTTEELYEVLKAFKEGDPNGNGIADEIPMTCINNNATSFLEELLACWGVPDKFGKFDGFLAVQNGEIKFAPIMDEWKEMIKWYNRLYTEGLLDPEVFTQKLEQYQAKLMADTSVVGVTWWHVNSFTNREKYMAIPPVHAPGYEVKWRIHPGQMGNKNMFFITNHCQDIEGAMRWVDSMYTEEATLENWFGPIGDTFTEVKDGMYYVSESNKNGWLGESTVQNATNWPGVLESDAIGRILEPLDFLADQKAEYEMYKPYIADEIWPRPYYNAEDANRVSELQTDIFNLVDQMKASWITGESDIDAEWDQYKKDLENLGLAEYLEINQRAYDVFKTAMENVN